MVGLVVMWAGLAALSPGVVTAATGPGPPVESLAVLPFANTCGDAKQDYFAEGISGELLDALARISALQVAGRASSFSFKGRDVGYQTVASTLNVAALLEGGVCRFGNAVRMTVRLIDGADGLPGWSQTFVFDLKDISTARTAIALAVAGGLQVKLRDDEAASIELGGPHNARAYDEYLHAMRVYHKAARAAAMRAIVPPPP